jgi:hypothetical protein
MAHNPVGAAALSASIGHEDRSAVGLDEAIIDEFDPTLFLLRRELKSGCEPVLQVTDRSGCGGSGIRKKHRTQRSSVPRPN